MNIYDALILKALGGGGGTTVVANPEGEATDELEKIQVGSDIYEIPKDYAELDNKPQINSVTLSGNKTASELGLQPTLDGAQTVSGNPITVTDAEPMNAESVKVELEPKQDLHGYDKPWAGGAGKNLLNSTLNSYSDKGVTITKNDDGTYKLNGTSTETVWGQTIGSVTLKPGTYKLVGWNPNTPGLIDSIMIYIENHTNIQDYGQGGTTFTIEEETTYYVNFVIIGGTTIDTVIKPMITKDTNATYSEYAPYSNICPITGYSEVNVERVGKNKLPYFTVEEKNGISLTYDNGVVILNGTASANAFFILTNLSLASGTYTFSANNTEVNSGVHIALREIGATSDFADMPMNNLNKNNTYQNVSIGQAVLYIFSGTQLTNFRLPLQIELGNQPTTYEPYQGNTYTIDLDGTKYGGTLDVGSGILTLTHGSVTESDFAYQEGSSAGGLSWADYYTNNVVSNDSMCSKLQMLTNAWESTTPCYNIVDNERIRVYGNFTSQQDFEDKYANLQVVYELATPLTIQLTPTQIQMLENTNNISTDGTNIALKYQPNNVIGECKAYADEKCSEVLPPLPTTDGTYHLSCEVTSGVGVLSWVSDS